MNMFHLLRCLTKLWHLRIFVHAGSINPANGPPKFIASSHVKERADFGWRSYHPPVFASLWFDWFAQWPSMAHDLSLKLGGSQLLGHTLIWRRFHVSSNWLKPSTATHLEVSWNFDLSARPRTCKYPSFMLSTGPYSSLSCAPQSSDVFLVAIRCMVHVSILPWWLQL